MFFSTNILFANTSNDGKKKFDNIVVTSHGNYYEIIDNENNVCVYIRVEEETNRFGKTVYNLFCENEVTKMVAKESIKELVSTTLYGYGIPKYLTKMAADYIYEEVCDYFE